MDRVDVEALVKKKSAGAESLKILWKQAVNSLHPLCGDRLAEFVGAMDNPRTARLFAKYLSREINPRAASRQFLEEVDQSEYSLNEWIEAFQTLAAHVESTAAKTSLAGLCGYLQCCEASGRGSPRAGFALTVETMLRTHGFDGDS